MRVYKKKSLPVESLLVWLLNHKLHGTVSTLTIDWEYLHVLLLVPHISKIAIQSKKNQSFWEELRLVNVLNYVKILFFKWRYLLQLLCLRVYVVDIDIVVLRSRINQSCLFAVVKRQDSFILMGFQLLSIHCWITTVILVIKQEYISLCVSSYQKVIFTCVYSHKTNELCLDLNSVYNLWHKASIWCKLCLHKFRSTISW